VKRAFHEIGENFPEERVVPLHFGTGKRVAELRKTLQERGKVTAILCFSDVIACEVVYLLQEMGVSVPEGVSVMGFDNIQSKFLFPTMLTTISSSKSKMSGKAVEILLHAMEKPEEPAVRVCLPTKLVERASTGEKKERAK
jgi:LacI family transcriptional regulator